MIRPDIARNMGTKELLNYIKWYQISFKVLLEWDRSHIPHPTFHIASLQCFSVLTLDSILSLKTYILLTARMT